MSDIEIRTIGGGDNQEEGSILGAHETPLVRLFPNAYEDGIGEPRGGGIEQPSTLPNPRDISNIISDQDAETGNPLRASDWIWQWGQYIDHDLDLSEGVSPGPGLDPSDFFPILVTDPEDPLASREGLENSLIPLTRIPAEEGTGEDGVPRGQINELTSFIDASNVYGSELIRAAGLRSDLGNAFFGLAAEAAAEEGIELANPPEGLSPFDGKLLVSSDSYGTDGTAFPEGDPSNQSGEVLLPYNRASAANADPIGIDDDQEFIAGDVRPNEQIGLSAVHNLFVREHNALVDQITTQLDGGNVELTALYEQYQNEFVPTLELEIEPSEQQVRGEFLYEAARSIVGAEAQVISYQEFLPQLIGDQAEDLDQLDPEAIDPGISVEFSQAAYRLGHTLLSNQQRLIDGDNLDVISLQDAFFNPQLISQEGVDQSLVGLAFQESNDIDNLVVDGVREFLFGAGTGGFDLAAVNIQRGREVGIPGYTEVYEQIFGESIETFDDLDPLFGEDVAELFEQAYDSVDQIDLWIGGISEITGDANTEGLLGPTFSAIIEDQFARLQNNDAFFYQNQLADPESFLSVVTNSIDLDVADVSLSDILRANTANPELIPDDAFTVPFDAEIFGNDDPNTIENTEIAEFIDAGGGNDVVLGGGGNDIIFGQEGDDLLSGGLGDDILFGGANADSLEGGLGNDVYELSVATAGGDIITDTGGDDLLVLNASPIANEDGSATPGDNQIDLLAPTAGAIGIEKVGEDLVIDVNGNGEIDPASDITIEFYFAPSQAIFAGSGYIEQVGNLGGQEILDFFNENTSTLTAQSFDSATGADIF